MKSIFKTEMRMASKAQTVGSTDPTQPSTAVEERERLLHSTREQEIRIVRTRFNCSAERNLAMKWRIGVRPNVSSPHNCPISFILTNGGEDSP
jgi:hypothetical protein